MFKENKYSKTYFSIINRAKSRLIEGYTEKHHIIPKSIGGSDDSSNLVDLTAREHYICHLLLPKMTDGEDRYKMIYAYTIMSGRKIYGSRKYAFYKEEYSKINSELRTGQGNGMWGVDRSGEKNTFFGKKHSEETKRKISEKKKGQGKGIKKPPLSEEHKKLISKNTKSRATQYTFHHAEHGNFIGTTGDLAKAYNFSKTSEAYKLVKGEYKSYKGWKLG
jgi:hypothetical protein